MEMKKVVRKKVLISVICLFIIALILAIVFFSSNFGKMQLLLNEYEHRTFEVINDKNKASFDEVADYVVNHKELLNGDGEIIVGNDDNQAYMLSPDFDNVELGVHLSEALLNIINAFWEQNLEFTVIRVDGNEVAFVVMNEEFAIVYSQDGEKPTFIRSEDSEDGYSYYIKKLYYNWCAITGTI
jgi:uncharacterized membrane protein